MISEALQVLDADDKAWEALYASSRIQPLVLWYEEVVEKPQEAVKSVADYLGVRLDPSATVSVPEIRRQSREDSERWAEQHTQGRNG